MSFLASRRLLLAATLIGLGLLLLVLHYFSGLAGFAWPLFVILPGAALIAAGTSNAWYAQHVAAAGAVVTGAGVILAAQNASGYFQSWAYAWALLPAFAGAAIWTIGVRDGDEAAKAGGRSLMQWGVLIFVVLAAIFELFIFDHSWFDGGLVLALLLIAAGVLLLVSRRRRPSGRAPASGREGAAPER